MIRSIIQIKKIKKVDNVYVLYYILNGMNIIWDDEKNNWLILNRSISFEEISDKIINKDYIEILENPSRKDQQYFILKINDYTWVVPFIINKNKQIVLKTAFPSLKFHKKYGGNK